MSKSRIASASPRRYRGDAVPMRAIREFARQVAERFQPEKIILFGSHAYGTPHEDSDVDILVIMNTKNRNQAGWIRLAVPRQFPMDLLVRHPKEIERGLKDEDWFLREIMTKGKVLYEKADSPVGAKSRRRLGIRPARRRTSAANQR
jgi:predicted nucleotidyltransferase